MRKPLMAANWKMNKSIGEAVSFAGTFGQLLFDRYQGDHLPVDVLICPPSLSIPALCAIFAGDPVSIGAQNMYSKDKGAFTGEISPTMLKDAGCSFVIVGHSERRIIFGESDTQIAEKVRSALDNALVPIVCVGENLEQQEQGQTHQVISDMVNAALSKLSPDEVSSIVIAYEPIWAIGTGKEAQPDDAAQVISKIREAVDRTFGKGTSDELRVLYGGSVNSGNIRSFMQKDDIDGVLVGGASLDPEEFFKIVLRGRP